MTRRRPRPAARALAAAVALLISIAVVACEATPRPSSTSSAATVAPPVATQEPTVEPSPGMPSARSTEAAEAPAPTLPPPVGDVELEFLPRDFVPGSELRSAAGQVLWSGGPRTSTQVWRYLPGSDRPEVVVDLQRRNSTISDIVASAAGYAFVEVNGAEYGLGGYRVWFVATPGAQPIELDRGVAYGAGFPPTLAMDDRRIAWAAFDEPPGGDVSRLRVVEIDDFATVTTLRDTPVRDGLLWLPALDGDALWYAIIHPDWDGTAGRDEFHLERLDLATPAEPAERFEGTGNDFNPTVSPTHLAWKTSLEDFAALNWGPITVMNRRTSERRVVPMDNLNWPSLGERFLAFQELTRSRLAVFDLARGELVDLLPDELAGDVFVGGQSISGSLLTFYTQEPGGKPRIGWAMLPE